LRRLRNKLETILASGSHNSRRPLIGKGNESNIKGLYIIGDLAGAPVIKLAMAQGVEVIEYIASLPESSSPPNEGELDVLIIGAGAAGLNAALAAQEHGMKCVLLEKAQVASTIENFPEGKWIYAEPDTTPPKGKLYLDGASKEDLIARWHAIIRDNELDVRTQEPLTAMRKDGGVFIATTPKGEYRARKVVLATGQRGNPRKLGVPGESLEQVYHRLYSPRHYSDEDIVVVGGGNSAVEAALVLAQQNRVTLSYRKSAFARLFKDNQRKIDAAVAEGRMRVVFNSNVHEFRAGQAELELEGGERLNVPMDHAFVLIGAELPVKFLKSLGIKLENEWDGALLFPLIETIALFFGLWFMGPLLDGPTPMGWNIGATGPIIGGLLAAAGLAGLIYRGVRGNKWSWLFISFFIWYSIYGIKAGRDVEFWPYRGWGYDSISLLGRPWAFWYTVLYTVLMTVFGLRALKRWGLDRRDKFQIWRFASLLSFQWVFFFIIPEFLFQIAVRNAWVGESLASNPQFAEQAWRAYGIVYAWPLFFYTWFYDPHMIWVVWGVLLTFVLIPILVLFHGKRYCSWICGCGGLAETFGDQWRHLAPKGRQSVQLEWMAAAVLWFAVIVTLLILLRDVHGLFQTTDVSAWVYRIVADIWLVGILPVTLYPFMGGKVWCRYWCPLAKLMHYQSKLFTKLGWSRFQIVPNNKCIACNECSRNCQVGIDVMQYALKQETLDNDNSSCIGCGICVTVCPMDTLSFETEAKVTLPVVQN
jgi:thioredoxin reductase/polyferredoxin